MGHDILSKSGVQAISDGTVMTFTLSRLDRSSNRLEVNVVSVQGRKAIEIHYIDYGVCYGSWSISH